MLTRKAVKNAFLKNTPDYKPTKRDILREEKKQNVEYWKRVLNIKTVQGGTGLAILPCGTVKLNP
jgi:hypothetical protein